MGYQAIVKESNDLLDANPEWEDRYAGYAEEIIKNKGSYEAGRKLFRVRKPLTLYTSVTLAKQASLEYDLRFAGQSVAAIYVKKGSVTISTEGKDNGNKEYFGVTNKLLGGSAWDSPEALQFRAAFTEELKAKSKSKSKSKEHRVENLLLTEFSKTDGTLKKLCNIQPVKLSKMFFQMPTPFSASKLQLPVKYAAENGGGIDILSRIRHSSGEVRLCVMELKDENKPAEPPAKVMKQVLAYATFLAHLLNSRSGEQWYEIFGFKRKKPRSITIHVVVLMPKGTDKEDFMNEPEIPVGEGATLKLCSLYFDEKYNFTGSLIDEIRSHKSRTT